MFKNLEDIKRKQEPNIGKLNYSTYLGQVGSGLSVNKVTIMSAGTRPELNRGVMPTLVNGYSTSGFDINPFDMAYRADTREEYLVDYGVFTVRFVASASTGGTVAAGRTALSYLLGMVTP